MNTVRTRFAPSPTGYLHLGGARTALFAWAWARQNGGKFLLRIEDTDKARSSDAHTQAIIEAMEWLGFDADGAVILQSNNVDYHRQVALQMQELQAAYDDNGALRLKIPKYGEVFFEDRICGRLAVQNCELEDPVLMRSDGAPTYIFASALDDIQEGITDIIRGDDHVRNTHKQLHIYKALGKTPPRFSHLPMILSADGERLSKRHAAVDVMQYQKEGFLSTAMINYLARLSWSHGDVEVFDANFLVKHFNFESAQRSPARFDMAKLRWLNAEHLRALPTEKIRDYIPNVSDAALALILPRSETLTQAREQAQYFIHRPQVSQILLDKYISDDIKPALRELIIKLTALSEWNSDIIKSVIKDTIKVYQLKFMQLGMPMRALLTASEKSPDIAQVAAVLGKEETLARMKFE